MSHTGSARKSGFFSLVTFKLVKLGQIKTIKTLFTYNGQYCRLMICKQSKSAQIVVVPGQTQNSGHKNEQTDEQRHC